MCGRLATPAVSQATWIRAMLRSTRSMSITAQGVPYSRAIRAATGVVLSGLFDFFAQHFELQPAILGGGKLLLRLRDRSGSLVELVAIFSVEVGIVKQLLLPGDLGVQFLNRL